MTEAGPEPGFRSRSQAPADWIAVHIFELLDGFVVIPHIEVVVTTLPKSYISRPFELSGNLLLEHLKCDGERNGAGLTDQYMHVFRHDYVFCDDEAVALPDFFQFLLKNSVSGTCREQGLPSVTTECDEVEVARMLIAD